MVGGRDVVEECGVGVGSLRFVLFVHFDSQLWSDERERMRLCA